MTCALLAEIRRDLTEVRRVYATMYNESRHALQEQRAQQWRRYLQREAERGGDPPRTQL